MTARDDFASKQRGFRVGIDDYMVKPIDLGRTASQNWSITTQSQNRSE